MTRSSGGFKSAKNGDRARFQKNRKRVLLQRVKIRELVRKSKEGAAKPETK